MRLLLALLLFASANAVGQNLAIMIKFQVDGGNFNESKVTITENGKEKEVFSPGKSKMIPELEFDKNYIITFEKPGYITKRVEISTQKVPEDIRGANLDFDFAVEIFQQYEGVNTVVFNQPVAKWFYDTQEDEFTYDTDYTKSIRSALINFEKEYEEVKKAGPKVDAAAIAAQKAEEERMEAEATAKAEEEKRKLAAAKAEEEQRQQADAKRLAEESLKKEEAERAKQLAQEEKAASAAAKLEEEKRQNQLKAEEDERKVLAAKAEEADKLASAKAEEEAKSAVSAKLKEAERARKKAELEDEIKQSKLKSAEEEKRRAELERAEIERRQREADARRIEEQRLAAENAIAEEKRKLAAAAKAEEEAKKQASENAAFEEERRRKAKAAFEAEQRAKAQAESVSEAQKRERSLAMAKMEEERKSLSIKDAGAFISRSEEIIKEVNRTITQITIERERMTYVYKKVVYNWGGVYYFRGDDSITNAVFKLETAE